LSHNISIADFKTLARSVTLVENEAPGFDDILRKIRPRNIPVIGLTGPPGAGKSTLLNALISLLLEQNKKVGLVLIDPSSPFNLGALLGDRLRLGAYFNNENIYIRSLATRGSLGGLSDKIIEVVEVMKAYPFDYIFIETVGVGQSEVEIAGLADTTVLVLTPESGDTIQTMKAGLMEIADIFVVNKADRSDAEALCNSILLQFQLSNKPEVPVLKTVAVESTGIKELLFEIENYHQHKKNKERKLLLLAEKALRIIAKNRMKNFDVNQLKADLQSAMHAANFNLYSFVQNYI
jgi:LAO/AO transport system kinase